jgi:hypothetical protein
VEGEDGDLGFRFEVHDPVEGDSGLGVLADFADAVDLLAAAERERDAEIVSVDHDPILQRAVAICDPA